MKLGVNKATGQFFKITGKGEKVEIPANQYYALQFAGESNPAAAGAFKAADRYANVLDMVGVDTNRDNPQYQNTKNALQQQFPKSTMAGDVAPYMMGPASLYTSVPRAMATGGVMGGAFANEGEGGFDTALGTLFGGAGNMAGRIFERLSPFARLSGKGGPKAYKKPMETTAQKLKSSPGRSFESSIANTTAGAGPANIFGRENQIRLNQLVADSIGLDGSKVRRIKPSMLTRVGREADEALDLAKINLDEAIAADELAKASSELAKGIQPTNKNMYAQRSQLQRNAVNTNYKLREAKRVWDKASATKQSVLAVKGATGKNGNIDLDKIYENYSNLARELPDVSQEVIDQQLGAFKPVMQRLDELTDPDTGLFISGDTKGEELIAQVIRGLSPLGGIQSAAMFGSSMAPIGLGGQLGARSGASAGAYVDSKQDQISNDLYNWSRDENRGVLDKAGDVAGKALDAYGAAHVGKGLLTIGQGTGRALIQKKALTKKMEKDLIEAGVKVGAGKVAGGLLDKATD